MTITAITPARVVVLLTAIIVSLVLLLAISVHADAGDATGAGDTARVAGSVTYVVQGGDTLWDIAVDHTPAGDDVRELVHDIKAMNELDSSMILVGQVLEIPLRG